MKRNKVMKNLYMLLAGILAIALLPSTLKAQDSEKEVKIKVVKEKNGERTVIDTTINIGDLNDLEGLEDIDVILKEHGLEDMDIDVDLGDLDEMLESLDIEIETHDLSEGDHEKIIVIKRMGEDGDEEEKEVMYKVMLNDSMKDGKVMKMKVGTDSYSYIISDGGDVHDVMTDDGEHKVLMFTSEDGKKTEVIVGGEGVDWVGDGQRKIEVVEGDEGKKVIVENEDGTTREYDLPDEKGTYIIGEDGELEKIEKDVVWVDDDKGMQRISVTVGDDNEAMIISEDGEVIELLDVNSDKSIYVTTSESGAKEQEVIIELIEKEEGGKTVRVKSKIVVESVDDEDLEKLVSSGAKIDPAKNKDLEIKNLKFHPNPSDGRFNLEFSTPQEGTTEVIIYNINGKKVYEERIVNFKGHYKKEIDISSSGSGTYFLEIIQGNKASYRKIILD